MADILLQGKIIIKGQIKAETALHIGGSKTGIDIGGVDNTVIKDHEGRPYIPGSSLKGKMRSLLEKAEDALKKEMMTWQVKPDVEENKGRKRIKKEGIRLHLCDEAECSICNIFGRNNGEHFAYYDPLTEHEPTKMVVTNTSPTRLIVRDAKLIASSIPDEVKEHLELEWTEVKFENSIDRITSAANPRQQERVPRDAKFEFEMVYSIYTEQDKERLRKVLKAMQLLEDDYLGGSGSRGYGKVSFNDLKLFWNSNADYEKGNTEISVKTPRKEGNPRTIARELEDNNALTALFAS